MDKWEDTYYPAWGDSGKKVELLLRNGTSVIGKLSADDFSFDGEGEYPIFNVYLPDESYISFSEHRKWRFV